MSKKKENKALYILGSIAIGVGAAIVVPKLIDYVSSYLYEKQPRNIENQDDDDWGPEIVKKSEDN